MTAWPVAPLGSVATIDRSVVDPRDLPDGTLYVGLEDIPSGGGTIRPIHLTNGQLASAKFRFGPKHLLFGKLRPYLAKVASVTFEGVCSTDILPIRPGPCVEREYLRHYLLHPAVVARAASLATGANLPRLGAAALESFAIPLPALPEQRRIANILDQADALRVKRRVSIAELDELTQSIFHEMFGDPIANPMAWPEGVVLGDVADITSGVTKGRRLSRGITRDVPYLAVVNVQERRLDLRRVKVIAATEAEIARYRLHAGDVLLTEGGDPDKLGRGCLWSGELPECIHQNHIFRVRLADRRLDAVYLSWLVGSERGKRYFLRSAKQTTGIASINRRQLRAFPLLMPPIEAQLEFAQAVERVGNVRDVLLRSMHQLDALFASLRHHAFRGEL